MIQRVKIKERPILFNGEMVRAILNTGKTQTRRPLEAVAQLGAVTEFGISSTPGYAYCMRDKQQLWHEFREDELLKRCPLGNVGDRLYVRETWGTPFPEDEWKRDLNEVRYRATDPEFFKAFKAKPSIHMPRWASRLTLEITDVRVQRVNEICEQDAIAEGAEPNWVGDLTGWSAEEHGYRGRCCHYPEGCECFPNYTAREWFKDVWEAIYNTWNQNPWAWAATFKVI